MVEIKDIDKLVVVGDRVLVKPTLPKERTQSGLFYHPVLRRNIKFRVGMW